MGTFAEIQIHWSPHKWFPYSKGGIRGSEIEWYRVIPMGDSGTSLGVCPINRTRVWSLELCYEVVTVRPAGPARSNVLWAMWHLVARNGLGRTSRRRWRLALWKGRKSMRGACTTMRGPNTLPAPFCMGIWFTCWLPFCISPLTGDWKESKMFIY